jgi:hypothetical protein
LLYFLFLSPLSDTYAHICKENFGFPCCYYSYYCKFSYHFFTAKKENRNEREGFAFCCSLSLFFSLSNILLLLLLVVVVMFYAILMMTAVTTAPVVVMILLVVLPRAYKQQEYFFWGK